MQTKELITKISDKISLISTLYDRKTADAFLSGPQPEYVRQAFANPKVQDLLELDDDLFKKAVKSLPKNEGALLLQQCMQCLNQTSHVLENLDNAGSIADTVSAVRRIRNVLV
jgi:hypothetical protein